MAAAQSVQRAQLEIEGQGTVPCLFNPQSYTIAKENSYSVRPVPGASLSRPQFAGGQPRRMSLELLLDVTLSRPPRPSVRPITDQLFKMMEVASNGSGTAKAPPTVTFRWGAVESFKAVPTRLEVQYVLFKPDGEPARAFVSLDLLQVEAADSRSGTSTPKPQNPTTRADRVGATHVVQQGDTLASIAYQHYGDPTVWRRIAHANDIDDPASLRAGAHLTVPLETA